MPQAYVPQAYVQQPYVQNPYVQSPYVPQPYAPYVLAPEPYYPSPSIVEPSVAEPYVPKVRALSLTPSLSTSVWARRHTLMRLGIAQECAHSFFPFPPSPRSHRPV